MQIHTDIQTKLSSSKNA